MKPMSLDEAEKYFKAASKRKKVCVGCYAERPRDWRKHQWQGAKFGSHESIWSCGTCNINLLDYFTEYCLE